MKAGKFRVFFFVVCQLVATSHRAPGNLSGNKEEVDKIKEQIAAIWDKAKAAAWE